MKKGKKAWEILRDLEREYLYLNEGAWFLFFDGTDHYSINQLIIGRCSIADLILEGKKIESKYPPKMSVKKLMKELKLLLEQGGNLGEEVKVLFFDGTDYYTINNIDSNDCYLGAEIILVGRKTKLKNNEED